MCIGLETITLISTLAGIVGTGVSGIATMQAANAEKDQARKNAIIAQRNADDARKRGEQARQDAELQSKQMLGKQINILSERAIDVGSGSPLDILGDTAMFGKMDALTIRNNYEREAIAHETQAMNFNASAEQAGMKARATMFGTGLSMFQTALGGYSEYRRMKGMRL